MEDDLGKETFYSLYILNKYKHLIDCTGSTTNNIIFIYVYKVNFLPSGSSIV